MEWSYGDSKTFIRKNEAGNVLRDNVFVIANESSLDGDHCDFDSMVYKVFDKTIMDVSLVAGLLELNWTSKCWEV